MASVTDGTLPLPDLDLAVQRVLRVKARLGLFEQPLVANTSEYYRWITSPEP